MGKHKVESIIHYIGKKRLLSGVYTHIPVRCVYVMLGVAGSIMCVGNK